eukprot:CAMPEP_0118882096 /NCGR_PEP_ID=MMETSP1163-20130328/21430_1 /TAXON_ID=124430 /ORGANISM="Phaeomonas parva, Strain CCMP2877" /LENGTH=174 /DNA_ID=CAMNT_0006819055 /DNA_START=507 /DNA_END=1029 /DNA_ORIENTATION=-
MPSNATTTRYMTPHVTTHHPQRAVARRLEGRALFTIAIAAAVAVAEREEVQDEQQADEGSDGDLAGLVVQGEDAVDREQQERGGHRKRDGEHVLMLEAEGVREPVHGEAGGPLDATEERVVLVGDHLELKLSKQIGDEHGSGGIGQHGVDGGLARDGLVNNAAAARHAQRLGLR